MGHMHCDGIIWRRMYRMHVSTRHGDRVVFRRAVYHGRYVYARVPRAAFAFAISATRRVGRGCPCNAFKSVRSSSECVRLCTYRHSVATQQLQIHARCSSTASTSQPRGMGARWQSNERCQRHGPRPRGVALRAHPASDRPGFEVERATPAQEHEMLAPQLLVRRVETHAAASPGGSCPHCTREPSCALNAARYDTI
jgi:hypothetical protein